MTVPASITARVNLVKKRWDTGLCLHYPRTGLQQTCKRTKTPQKPPTVAGNRCDACLVDLRLESRDAGARDSRLCVVCAGPWVGKYWCSCACAAAACVGVFVGLCLRCD